MNSDIKQAIQRLAEMVAEETTAMTIDDIGDLENEIEGLINDFIEDVRTATNE